MVSSIDLPTPCQYSIFFYTKCQYNFSDTLFFYFKFVFLHGHPKSSIAYGKCCTTNTFNSVENTTPFLCWNLLFSLTRETSWLLSSQIPIPFCFTMAELSKFIEVHHDRLRHFWLHEIKFGLFICSTTCPRSRLFSCVTKYAERDKVESTKTVAIIILWWNCKIKNKTSSLTSIVINSHQGKSRLFRKLLVISGEGFYAAGDWRIGVVDQSMVRRWHLIINISGPGKGHWKSQNTTNIYR